MSGSDKKQSSNLSGGGGVDDEEDEIDGPVGKSCSEEEIGEKREKRVSFFRFNSAKKKLLLLQKRKKRKKGGNSVNSRRSGKWVGSGCCLCLKQPMTLDSSAESPASDPNSEEFTYDMLRVFIEKNVFYAKECNPHLDDK